jgi:methionyl-tRNA formyltransferase
MRPPWKIIFFGTPPFAIPALKGLLEGPDPVVAVVTQPDRRKGRGQKVIPTPVKELALQHALTVLQPERVKEEIFLERIGDIQPDLFVVVAYGQILPKSLLVLPKHGAVNVHGSLLPKYRGAAPIPWAILKGEEVTGVTTMMMDEGMDTGGMLLQAKIPIGERETGESLHDRMALSGALLLRETVQGMKTGTVHPTPQDPTLATYAPSIKKEDGTIDWRREAREIDRQVRALNPWPGAFTRWDGKFLKIYKGEVREERPRGKAGTVAWVGADFIEVETGKDSFLIQEVQLEGGKKMDARNFLSGHPIPVGTTFEY